MRVCGSLAGTPGIANDRTNTGADDDVLETVVVEIGYVEPIGVAPVQGNRIPLLGSKQWAAVGARRSLNEGTTVEFVQLQLEVGVDRWVGGIEVLRQDDEVELPLVHP